MTRAIPQTYLQELQMAQDHVALGKLLVARQQAIAGDLRLAGGLPAVTAETLLRLLEDSQRLFENHADSLKRKLVRKP